MYKVSGKRELKKIIKEKLIPLDTLDISNVKDMSSLFEGVMEINGSIADWDTSKVTNMDGLFRNSFIQPDISS